MQKSDDEGPNNDVDMNYFKLEIKGGQDAVILYEWEGP